MSDTLQTRLPVVGANFGWRRIALVSDAGRIARDRGSVGDVGTPQAVAFHPECFPSGVRGVRSIDSGDQLVEKIMGALASDDRAASSAQRLEPREGVRENRGVASHGFPLHLLNDFDRLSVQQDGLYLQRPVAGSLARDLRTPETDKSPEDEQGNFLLFFAMTKQEAHLGRCVNLNLPRLRHGHFQQVGFRLAGGERFFGVARPMPKPLRVFGHVPAGTHARGVTPNAVIQFGGIDAVNRAVELRRDRTEIVAKGSEIAGAQAVIFHLLEHPSQKFWNLRRNNLRAGSVLQVVIHGGDQRGVTHALLKLLQMAQAGLDLCFVLGLGLSETGRLLFGEAHRLLFVDEEFSLALASEVPNHPVAARVLVDRDFYGAISNCLPLGFTRSGHLEFGQLAKLMGINGARLVQVKISGHVVTPIKTETYGLKPTSSMQQKNRERPYSISSVNRSRSRITGQNWPNRGGTDMRPACKTPRCRNSARSSGLDCPRCHMRAWRASRPMRAAYATLRDHARARDVEFTIAFEYFEQFARQCEYLERTGPFAQCLTVDRIDNRLGYIPGNIAPLSRAENARKRMLYDAARTRAGLAWGIPGALLHPVDTGEDSFAVVVGDMADSEAQACFEQWRARA